MAGEEIDRDSHVAHDRDGIGDRTRKPYVKSGMRTVSTHEARPYHAEFSGLIFSISAAPFECSVW
jgi:hypothetical protein